MGLRVLDVNRYAATTTTLTASSAAAGLPVGATQHPDRTSIWRSAVGTGVQTIDVDLGSSLTCDVIAGANIKLLGTGVLQLWRGASLGAETTLVTTLPAQDRDTRTAVAFFTAVASRYWRLKWTNPTAASTYAELGVCALADHLELARHIRVPSELQRVDPSIGTRALDGQLSVATRTKYFAGRWEFSDISEADLTELRTLFDALGTSTPYFVVLDTGLPWTCWYVRFAGPLGTGLGVLSGRYTVSLPWEEAR